MRRLLACATAALVAAVSTAKVSGDWQIATLNRTQRVLRDQTFESKMSVALAGACNEWESFQILVRSDSPLGGVSVAAGDLHGPEGAVLDAADARLFRQHQFRLDVGTYRNEAFQPGWYPDALIPFAHPVSGEPLENARFRAVPFDLPADQTHGFWVDLWIPPDASPGDYRGTYRVATADGQAKEIAVTLTVWDFQLPEVPTLQTALGSPAARMRAYYRQRAAAGKESEPEDWAAVETQCAELLSRHRINATPPSGSLTPQRRDDGSYRIPPEQIADLRRFVDRYHINALQVASPAGVVEDPQSQRQELGAYLAAWDRAAEKLDRPQVVFYTYLKDEPNDAEAYRYVQRWGRAIRQADSAVKVLVVEQTSAQDPAWGDLYGAVDIWCPLFSLFDPESAARRRALGETVWTYTALCQGAPTPWWHTDYPLLNYRVPAWIAWRYRIRGLLYWGGMSFWSHVEDPWTEPGTLDRRQQSPKLLFHGEGSIVYPARAVGYEGIAGSLRLKALRDAIEDYEYLAILERRGRASPAEQIVLPLAGSWHQWQPDPAAYEAARRRLAAVIVTPTGCE